MTFFHVRIHHESSPRVREAIAPALHTLRVGTPRGGGSRRGADGAADERSNEFVQRDTVERARNCDGPPPRHARFRLRVRRFVAGAGLLTLISGCAADPSYDGRTAGEWIAQLEASPDSLERRAAARALGKVLAINPGSERVTAALVRALADPSDEVRLDAGTALVQDHRLAASAVPGLLLALRDSAYEHTREHAAELLATATPENASAVVSALIDALDDPSERVRLSAVRALARLKGAPGAAVALQRALIAGSPAARDGARQALETCPGIPPDPVPR